ncbi:hypothetical protein BpHYR1_007485 [Brachionus plicatilis]|uniref:Uncharacterized protein n=1 Tax=Brachionus plicatilis TaxID=10195 RepID=A0A3M7S5L9_BRAPC|nr:hypothetical protein BpHYR1_007485 [Brachionus plicatilis]
MVCGVFDFKVQFCRLTQLVSFKEQNGSIKERKYYQTIKIRKYFYFFTMKYKLRFTSDLIKGALARYR